MLNYNAITNLYEVSTLSQGEVRGLIHLGPHPAFSSPDIKIDENDSTKIVWDGSGKVIGQFADPHDARLVLELLYSLNTIRDLVSSCERMRSAFEIFQDQTGDAINDMGDALAEVELTDEKTEMP